MGNYPALGEVLAMNAQALFDHIARHLVTQGRPCRRENDDGTLKCLYRNAHGHACAIGAIIPDELYGETLEGRGLSDLIRFIWSEQYAMSACSTGTTEQLSPPLQLTPPRK